MQHFEKEMAKLLKKWIIIMLHNKIRVTDGRPLNGTRAMSRSVTIPVAFV